MAASAPGKLILFGEHAVVFGEPALSTAIHLRTEVFARPNREWLVDGASLDEPRYRYVKAALQRSWAGGPLWIEIRSMIPTGAGLGSSAAVTVASLAAVSAADRELDRAAIARQAFEIEHDVQGRASPIDTSTATAGGGVLVRSGEDEDHLWTIRRDTRAWSLHRCRLPELTLVVGNTGLSAATGPLVAGVKKRVDASPDSAAIVKEIGQITVDGVAALRRKDFVAAGELMDRDHELLNALGVGHPLLDKLVRAARGSSYGAKLTGAGGGGSMFALTDHPEKTAGAIRAAGGKPFLVRSDPDGVRRIP